MIRETSYVVFWLENREPKAITVDSIDVMLFVAAQLRDAAREGEPITHICTSSEVAEMVGEMGVSDPPFDYYWPKRRDGV